MALYAIGDVQGCMTSLERLLARLPLTADDRLWLVGDLVNRGPRSLEVLRWARGEPRVTVVLGNHDLHLLGRIAGTAAAKRRDTLDSVLAAPDIEALADWLRAQPLIHVEAGRILVHAGLHPRWSATTARALAAELEAGLRAPTWKRWLAQLDGATPRWRDALTGAERVRGLLSYFVRVRTCSPDGAANPDFDGHPRDAPKGFAPWFALPEPAWGDHEVVFGHWAALGLDLGKRHVATDSGCVWGKRLSAVRLDDRAVFQVNAAE
ncbi:MAG: symmetrical bis(5'-nucleosyl)-tetraphosphatase [Deltaproteobacteria bacterium]|nr:symmetrical bis(5'-nucleosyl)-tetraphosphatase [Deltaproteobacteria bacterium]